VLTGPGARDRGVVPEGDFGRLAAGKQKDMIAVLLSRLRQDRRADGSGATKIVTAASPASTAPAPAS
jgi:hypothetical protein